MSEHFRLKVRNEIELYLEEKRKNEEELDIQIMPFFMGVTSLLMSFVVSLGISGHLTYYLYFSLFFITANILCFFIVRSKFNTKTKNTLLTLPALLHLGGLILPPILFNL